MRVVGCTMDVLLSTATLSRGSAMSLNAYMMVSGWSCHLMRQRTMADTRVIRCSCSEVVLGR